MNLTLDTSIGLQGGFSGAARKSECVIGHHVGSELRRQDIDQQSPSVSNVVQFLKNLPEYRRVKILGISGKAESDVLQPLYYTDLLTGEF